MESNDQTLRFKTNINCGGCVARVTPVLNESDGICHWNVDTQSPDKILAVHTAGISEAEIIEKVSAAGFQIESLNP